MSEVDTFVYESQNSEFTIGRSSEADFTINNSELSRMHCKVYIQDQRVFIEDLGSKNGVIVDGAKIVPQKMIEIFPESSVLITKELELNIFGQQTRTSLRLENFKPPKPLVRYKRTKV